ncbi:hypothetical protein [Haloferax sp. ATB1]|uniref:hypothetical protein n=1 Tax=Haloferax sp. ATB1 TaxID=1508454 RepID=UPI0005B1FBFA|nr:hypothetical protein [Haloferax sp. ATB1]
MSDWESPVPDAQASAGANELAVTLDIESTTVRGSISAEVEDRVNHLYVEVAHGSVVFEVGEEFRSLSTATTFTPEQARALATALEAAAERASEFRDGLIVRKYNLAGGDE